MLRAAGRGDGKVAARVLAPARRNSKTHREISMRVDPTTGLVTTAPVETPRESHETRTAAAIPPDDIDDGDDGARAKPRFATDFRESDVDDGFLKLNLWLRDNLLDERAFILGVVNEFIAEKLEQRDREITELRVELAECKGLLQRHRSKDDERRTETIVVEAPNSKMADLLDRQIHELRAQVAELRGQIAGINTRERGPAGPQGERGHRGPPGRPGRKGDAGMTPRMPTLKMWWIEREKFRATPVMSDGSHGPVIELRDLFVEFQRQTT
jgi:DNA-binding transcriptional MerR regulator